MTAEPEPISAAGAGSCPAAALPRHELFEHAADIGVRGFGRTKSQAFAEAACAVTALVCDPCLVRDFVTVHFSCTAPDDELLLARWLNEVIFAMDNRRLLFRRFDVVVGDGWLRAVGHGEPLQRDRHRPTVEPKGATLTELHVRRVPGGWIAQCVVDV